MTAAESILGGGAGVPGGAEKEHVRPLNGQRFRPHGRRRPRFRDAWPARRLVVVLLGLIGIGVLVYPSAAAWVSDQEHAGQVAGYAQSVQQLATADQQGMLDAAHAYNDSLPVGPIRDPYTVDAAGEPEAVGGGLATYRDTLDVGDGGMMGVLDIPEIGVSLPIYHGTSDETLAKGVGQLYGTSLPVVGPDTHAVLTGHSGYVNATLLDGIRELKLGDTFTVTVLGEVLTYQVDQILTVLPDETQALQRVAGQDYVTLVTCTPIGINTHRLLVRGHRIPTPPATDATQALLSNARTTFPWWALGVGGGVVVVWVATLPLRRRARGGPRHSWEEW